MTKPSQRPRRELRVFISKGLLDLLSKEARENRRSVTGQVIVLLEERYGKEDELIEAPA